MPALSESQVKSLNAVYGDAWKAPLGPYQQAPPEFGSGWWMVNPFTGPHPWEAEGPGTQNLPPGFEEIFGPRPGNGQPTLPRWLNDLKFFKQAGLPPEFDPVAVGIAGVLTSEWGMGKPHFYEGRYGWKARFPEQDIVVPYEADVFMTVENTHWVIAYFQARALQQGKIPSKKHPFVPPHMWPETN